MSDQTIMEIYVWVCSVGLLVYLVPEIYKFEKKYARRMKELKEEAEQWERTKKLHYEILNIDKD